MVDAANNSGHSEEALARAREFLAQHGDAYRGFVAQQKAAKSSDETFDIINAFYKDHKEVSSAYEKLSEEEVRALDHLVETTPAPKAAEAAAEVAKNTKMLDGLNEGHYKGAYKHASAHAEAHVTHQAERKAAEALTEVEKKTKALADADAKFEAAKTAIKTKIGDKKDVLKAYEHLTNEENLPKFVEALGKDAAKINKYHGGKIGLGVGIVSGAAALLTPGKKIDPENPDAPQKGVGTGTKLALAVVSAVGLGTAIYARHVKAAPLKAVFNDIIKAPKAAGL